MKVFRITYGGISAYYVAETRGRARTCAARVLCECFNLEHGEALKKMRCVRVPKYDNLVFTEGGVSEIVLLEAAGQLRLKITP